MPTNVLSFMSDIAPLVTAMTGAPSLSVSQAASGPARWRQSTIRCCGNVTVHRDAACAVIGNALADATWAGFAGRVIFAQIVQAHAVQHRAMVVPPCVLIAPRRMKGDLNRRLWLLYFPLPASAARYSLFAPLIAQLGFAFGSLFLVPPQRAGPCTAGECPRPSLPRRGSD